MLLTTDYACEVVDKSAICRIVGQYKPVQTDGAY